jgi:hypothetical protein
MIEAAYREAGLNFAVADPEDVVVRAGRDVEVFVHDIAVDPRSSYFHAKTPQAPTAQVGYRNVLELSVVLESAGFWCAVPWALNVRSDDKMAAILAAREAGLATIESARVGTRQLKMTPPVARTEGLTVAKPTRWHGGHGVMDLTRGMSADAYLQILSATETPALFQERIDALQSDTRVYVANGRPVLALVRTASDDVLVTNVSSGGSGHLSHPPEPLVNAAENLAKRFPCPWLGVDFLVPRRGTALVSEVEVDAGTVPFVRATVLRGKAYRSAFIEWRRGLQSPT